ncbi:MAG: hypothetical protein WCO69_06530 [Candidatus Omnitrophota bacterium]
MRRNQGRVSGRQGTSTLEFMMMATVVISVIAVFTLGGQSPFSQSLKKSYGNATNVLEVSTTSIVNDIIPIDPVVAHLAPPSNVVPNK